MSTARLHVTLSTDGRRYRVRWVSDDAQLWRAILVDFRAAFRVHSECIFCSTTRSWSLPLRCRRRLVDWADAWFSITDQRWDDDREEEPEPATSGGPPGGAPATLEAAYRVLHLYPTAPPELVAAAHRILIKAAHPDAGGSHAAAVQVNEAISIIRAAHRRPGRRSA